MKHIYLIDYENTAPNILTTLAAISPQDSWYYLFYSEMTKQPEWIMSHLPDKSIILKLINCHVGSQNAMDFQIVAMAGYISALHPNAIYIIVSNDKGYDAPIQMMQENGIRIFRTPPTVKKDPSMMDLKTLYHACIERGMIAAGHINDIGRVKNEVGKDANPYNIHTHLQRVWRNDHRISSTIYKKIKVELKKEGLM